MSLGLRRPPPQVGPGRYPQQNQTDASQGLNAASQVDQHVEQQDRGQNLEQEGSLPNRAFHAGANCCDRRLTASS